MEEQVHNSEDKCRAVDSVRYAVPLFPSENTLPIQNFTTSPKIIPEETNYQSTDYRFSGVNEMFNGFDILTLTLIIRLGDQVFYKLFTHKTPLTDWLNEHTGIAVLFCFLALIKVYYAYKINEAAELKKSPSKLAKIQSQEIEGLQNRVNFVLMHNPDIRERYSEILVEVVGEGKAQVCLVPRERSTLNPQQEAAQLEGSRPATASWREKLLAWLKNHWKKIAAVWAIINFPAMVYWVAWGLRSIFKSGGLGMGFSTGLDPFFIIFGMVLPLAITIGMYAPKLFNYINNKYQPNSKIWKFLDFVFYKPIPNKVQNKLAHFLTYISLHILNNIRACLGAIGISLMAIRYKLFGTEIPKQKKSAKIAEDMAKVMEQAFLVEKYQKAGLDINNIHLGFLPTQEAKPSTENQATTDQQQSVVNPDPWWSLIIRFLRQAAVGYVSLEFTWWWSSDVAGLLYQRVVDTTADISNVFSNPIAGWIIFLGSLLYGAASVVYRKYEQSEKKFITDDKERRKLRDQRLDWQLSVNNLNQWKKENSAVVKQLEKNSHYQRCPLLEDPKYAKDITLTSKPKWYDRDYHYKYYTANLIIFWIGVTQTGFWIGRGLNIPGTASNPGGWLCPWHNRFSNELHQNLSILFTCIAFTILYTAMTHHLRNVEKQDEQDQMLYSDDAKLQLVLEKSLVAQQVVTDSDDLPPEKNDIDLGLVPRKQNGYSPRLNFTAINQDQQQQPLLYSSDFSSCTP